MQRMLSQLPVEEMLVAWQMTKTNDLNGEGCAAVIAVQPFADITKAVSYMKILKQGDSRVAKIINRKSLDKDKQYRVSQFVYPFSEDGRHLLYSTFTKEVVELTVPEWQAFRKIKAAPAGCDFVAENGLEQRIWLGAGKGPKVVRLVPHGHVLLPLLVNFVELAGIGVVWLWLYALPTFLEAFLVVLPLLAVGHAIVIFAALQV